MANAVNGIRVCDHKWVPATKWKYKCSKCKKLSPLESIVEDAIDRGFVQGVGYVVAEIVRQEASRFSIAEEVARAAGYYYEDFKRSGVAGFDLKDLRGLERKKK